MWGAWETGLPISMNEAVMALQTGSMKQDAVLKTMLADLRTSHRELEEVWSRWEELEGATRRYRLAGEGLRLENVVEALKELVK